MLTIIVKAAPRLATILCRWLGRLAIPIGEALSAVAGAMMGRQNGAARDLNNQTEIVVVLLVDDVAVCATAIGSRQ